MYRCLTVGSFLLKYKIELEGNIISFLINLFNTQIQRL